MPKKSKRQSRKISASTTTAGAATSSATGGEVSPRTGYQEFNPDYTYVRKDLKRIGILAGSMFLFLIAMAFVLPMILYR